MLYRFFLSKKGFTMVEILLVVIVLGILTAVAVPLLGSIVGIKKREDCKNQRTVISATVKEVMYGMVDSGKSQGNKINFNRIDSEYKATYPGDGKDGDTDDAYVGRNCLVLSGATIEGTEVSPVTIGAIRGGYRPDPDNMDYDDGCIQGYYLKKKDYADKPLTEFLVGAKDSKGDMTKEKLIGLPICPFDDENNPQYHYYIFEDGTVLCDCPKCNQSAD
ncbi:MAG: type II secretion system protein [Acutalibacteraceae bacterium]